MKGENGSFEVDSGVNNVNFLCYMTMGFEARRFLKVSKLSKDSEGYDRLESWETKSVLLSSRLI